MGFRVTHVYGLTEVYGPARLRLAGGLGRLPMTSARR
jgi:hypothetical protein